MVTIEIINDGTGSPEKGNYNFEILINMVSLFKGRIENHDRRKGLKQLVRDLADSLEEKE